MKAVKSRKNSFVFIIVIFLSLIGVVIIVRRASQLIPIIIHGNQLSSTVNSNIPKELAVTENLFARYPALTLIHIIPALLFILLGPIQFNKKIRNKHIKWHRMSGRIFLVCGVIVGISALIMSFGMPAVGGVNQAAATIFFALLFLFCLYRAFVNILKRNITLHREWMIRGYSIGLAVTTIRPIVGIFFATSRLSGLTPYEFFGAAFWIGFVLHLIAAEAWINKTRSNKQKKEVTNPGNLL